MRCLSPHPTFSFRWTCSFFERADRCQNTLGELCVTLSQNERYLIRPLIEAIPAGYPSVVTRKTRDAGENDTMADAESTADRKSVV